MKTKILILMAIMTLGMSSFAFARAAQKIYKSSINGATCTDVYDGLCIIGGRGGYGTAIASWSS